MLLFIYHKEVKRMCRGIIPCDVAPPQHSKVRARCFTCKKWSVCELKIDYLKTLKLIEEVLGTPAETYQLIQLPKVEGLDFPFAYKYMPTDIKFNFLNKEEVGKFYILKYSDINNFNFVYDIKDYKILFKGIYEGGNNIKFNISEEDLFNNISLKEFEFPARIDTDEGWEYYYKPVSFSLKDGELDKAKNFLSSIETGLVNLKIPFFINAVYGNYNGEDRYPTPEEILADDSLILNDYCAATLNLPLEIKDNIISLQSNSLIKIEIIDEDKGPTLLKERSVEISLEETQKVFELFKQNSIKDSFSISNGVDIYYDFEVIMPEEIKEEIKVGLATIRDLILNENKDVDTIDTTCFKATLECQFYEWEKGLSDEDGLKRALCKYPNGIPLDSKDFAHIRTQHIDKPICCYHPAPPCHKIKGKTRDELNEY